MKKKIVVSNEVIAGCYKEFKEKELNLLGTILCYAKKSDGEIIEVDLSLIKKSAGFQNRGNNEFRESLEKVISKVDELNTIKRLALDDENIVQLKPLKLFKLLEADGDKLRIKTNNHIKYFGKKGRFGKAGNFTRFLLEDFISIRGKTAKLLYMRLMQFWDTGCLSITTEELKVLGIVKSCAEFHTKIWPSIANQLDGKLDDVTIKALKDNSGKIVIFEFYFRPISEDGEEINIPEGFIPNKRTVPFDDDEIFATLINDTPNRSDLVREQFNEIPF